MAKITWRIKVNESIFNTILEHEGTVKWTNGRTETDAVNDNIPSVWKAKGPLRPYSHGWPSTQPGSLHTALQHNYTQLCSLFSRGTAGWTMGGTAVWTMGQGCVQVPGCVEGRPWFCSPSQIPSLPSIIQPTPPSVLHAIPISYPHHNWCSMPFFPFLLITLRKAIINSLCLTLHPHLNPNSCTTFFLSNFSHCPHLFFPQTPTTTLNSFSLSCLNSLHPNIYSPKYANLTPHARHLCSPLPNFHSFKFQSPSPILAFAQNPSAFVDTNSSFCLQISLPLYTFL